MAVRPNEKVQSQNSRVRKCIQVTHIHLFIFCLCLDRSIHHGLGGSFSPRKNKTRKRERRMKDKKWNDESIYSPPPLFFIDFIFSHQQQQRLTLVCQSQTIWCQEKRKKSFSPGPPFQINTHRKQSSKKEEDGCNVISFVSRWCRVYVSWNVSPESCFSWFNHTLEEVGLISSSFRHLARKQTISFLFSFLPFSSCSRMFLPSDTWFWHWTIRYAKRIPPNNKVEIQYEKSLFI